jgi:hypothetical protein
MINKVMKKYLPIVLFVIGLIVVIGAFVFVRGRSTVGSINDDETVAELPLDKKPITTLTPSEDGHWLTLNVSKLIVKAETMDYELLYNLPDGRTQGVPGTIKLDGNDIERKLLLGSESSGKFRYDEGVEVGTLTLRFRDGNGKLVAKLTTDFHLQSDTAELTSVDAKFAYTLNQTADNAYFITMNSFGVEKIPSFKVGSGPFGVFSSSTTDLAGAVQIDSEKSYLWTLGDWKLLEDNKSENIGIFISAQ